MWFKEYSDDNPPKRGTAKKIYDALKANGFKVYDLHYNPNCWTRDLVGGWATWACRVANEEDSGEYWCGCNERGEVYLRGSAAPYAIFYLTHSGGN